MKIQRRSLITMAATACIPVAAAAARTQPPLRFLVCRDISRDEQEHVRDHAAGAMMAAVAINESGGVLGRELVFEPHPCGDSPAEQIRLERRLQGDTALLGLVATSSERLSLALTRRFAQQRLAVPHVAPWLPDPAFDETPGLVTLFASRQQQLVQAASHLRAMGLRHFGLVFDGADSRERLHATLRPALEARGDPPVPVWNAPSSGGIDALVASMPASPPAVLLFAGGTLELARFLIGLSSRGIQRMVVCFNDPDLRLLDELGALGKQALVLTQVVPPPASGRTRYARRYRELLARQFEEAPTTAGMAGFLAGLYAGRLCARLGAAPTRNGLMDELGRRTPIDLDGFTVRFDGASGRAGHQVTQTLLGRDGRVIA